MKPNFKFIRVRNKHLKYYIQYGHALPIDNRKVLRVPRVIYDHVKLRNRL